MRPKYKIWDKQESKWYEPTYLAYAGELEYLTLTESGELIMRTMTDSIHESRFPNRFEVVLFTGLKDSNGKEIYEGDIVEHRSIGGMDKGPWIGEVTINPTQGVKVGAWPISFDYQVIGNIYENPELLGKENEE